MPKASKKKTTTKKGIAKKTAKKRPSSDAPSAAKRPIAITLSPDLIDAVTEYADALSISRSSFIESVLRDAFAQGSLTAQAMTNDAIRKAFLEAFSRPGVMAEMTHILGTQLSENESQMLLEFLRSSEKQRPPKY